MSSPEHPSALEQKIKSQLDQSVRALDNETLQRLQAARRIALQSPKKWYEHWRMPSWLTKSAWLAPGSIVTGFVLCSVFAIVIGLPNHQTHTDLPTTVAHLEMADLAEEDDVLTDPGFYLWLEETNQAAGKSDYVEPAV